LAPNPFWGWCTLAVCTPNHQGSKIEPSDWIAGFLDKEHGHQFLYAMEVSERIHMDAYFKDKRFSDKKPRVRGSWMQRCGDNLYSLDAQGRWQQHETLFHSGLAEREKDTKNPWVFVATKFWYLGREAHPLPDKFKPLAGGRGSRVNHASSLIEHFKRWVQRNFSEGVTALPRDVERWGCGANPSLQPTSLASGCGLSFGSE
jgi:hypothetical protein